MEKMYIGLADRMRVDVGAQVTTSHPAISRA